VPAVQREQRQQVEQADEQVEPATMPTKVSALTPAVSSLSMTSPLIRPTPTMPTKPSGRGRRCRSW
jgi:hypothetical protein